ncbi:DUF998 domain-containing protein [Intrasporangium sp.]|uniref:DUF998 domain-containing protein n=1 Tax=Intrasporangium sp. TaxID=1925024 RepID=UPI00293A2DED|nr:DUF998 domain-containing protein [Intrasporangium sp.]MDV3220525.1 DUF998 domain-containing protein [Intrasporangium sp.]
MPGTEARKRSVLVRLGALCGLLAPFTFTVGWAVGGMAQPDAFSLLNDEVSDLGAVTADQSWIYNQVGANLTGLLVAALAFALWRAGSFRPPSEVGMLALGIVGVGVFLDGFLRLDCRAIDAGCEAGGTSGLATAHQVESLITVTAMFVAIFALARAFTKSEHWQGRRLPTLVAGFATVAGMIGGTMLSGFEVEGGGLAMRVGLTAWFAWVALVSYRLLHLDSGRARPTSTPDRHQSVASAATPHG